MSSNSAMTTKDRSAKAMASCTSFRLQGAGSIRHYGCEYSRKRSVCFSSYSGAMDLSEHDTAEEDGSGERLHFGEKKRRLTLEQLETLEKSFELGNKLQIERKMQLAQVLGVQPRQIAVWFQNRRARCKTKQLERDFNILNQEYSVLRSKYDILHQENRQFKAEVQRLNRELEKIHNNSKAAKSFKIESHQKQANSVHKPTNAPMELSVKMEIPSKISDPLQGIYPMTSKEGERCGIRREAANSVFHIHSPRTVETLPSPVSLITVANNSSPLRVEGYSVREQVAAGGLKPHPPGHVSHCLPKLEVDQSKVNQGEDICCNWFCSLEEEGTLMLREYWSLAGE